VSLDGLLPAALQHLAGKVTQFSDQPAHLAGIFLGENSDFRRCANVDNRVFICAYLELGGLQIIIIFTIFVLPYVLTAEKYFTINLLHEKVNFNFDSEPINVKVNE